MNLQHRKTHYYFRSFLLLGFSFLLADLLATGTISNYLAPKLHGLSYVTLVILVVLTGASLRQAIVGPTEIDCECPGDHTLPSGFFRSFIIYGLFALPLAMFFFMPEKILDSAAAEKKGLNLLTGDIKKIAMTAPATSNVVVEEKTNRSIEGNVVPLVPKQKEAPKNQVEKSEAEIRKIFANNDFGDFYTDIAVSMYKQPTIKLDDKIFLDGLTTLELYPKEFAGHKLETMGFVYLEPEFKQNQLVVARFSVSCCTADANVMGLLVETQNKHSFKKDSWVKVSGQLEVRRADEVDMLVLKAEQIQPVKAPKDPYVYYDFNQGQQ